ncbi:MAG TPA: MarR family transcriptional regulator [Caulobacteraceae bacterium]
MAGSRPAKPSGVGLGRSSPALVDMAGLEETLGFVLRLAQVAAFNDLIASLRPFELRPTDMSVLLVIRANPGLKQHALGEALHIQRPNLVLIIDQLQARDLVRREAVATDRRSHALRLTPAGEALIAAASEAHDRHVAKVTAAVGERCLPEVLEALRRVAALSPGPALVKAVSGEGNG